MPQLYFPPDIIPAPTCSARLIIAATLLVASLMLNGLYYLILSHDAHF